MRVGMRLLIRKQHIVHIEHRREQNVSLILAPVVESVWYTELPWGLSANA